MSFSKISFSTDLVSASDKDNAILVFSEFKCSNFCCKMFNSVFSLVCSFSSFSCCDSNSENCFDLNMGLLADGSEGFIGGFVEGIIVGFANFVEIAVFDLLRPGVGFFEF